ncbi:MAG: hypothetical protein AB7I57_15315 [Pirellulales bacterium]
MRMVWPQIVLAAALGGLCQAAVADEAKFFRVAEVDGAWWFVAPDGKPFFSSGVNVVDVGTTRERYSPQRPEYAAFRHYADTDAWVRATHQRLADWGFNTVGGWSAAEMTAGPLPYTFVLHLGKELGVPWNDVFAADFDELIAQAAEKQVKARANDPNLIGWYTDNELAWFADTLFAFHISQSPDSATRRELIGLLRRQYDGDFARLEEDFVPVDASNFDELAAGGKLLLRPGGRGMAVVDAFLGKVAERFYQAAHSAIRRLDQQHLILGDRYHGFCPDAVAEAAGPYVDVISTNFDQPMWTSGRLPEYYLERLHRLTKRPVLITEYYVAARENRSGNKNSGDIFTIVDSQEQRAAAVRTRLTWFASLPYVVGAHWFQFSDEPTHGRHDGEDYNFGLVDIEDRPYDKLVGAFKATNAAAVSIHRESGSEQSEKNARPISVPPASADPLAGIADWKLWQATIPCEEAGSLGDLLVCADRQKMYVALSCSSFVDPAAYAGERPGSGEQQSLKIALDGGEPCVVRFGIGDEYSVSDPKVEVRVHQRGLRYVVILALPNSALNLDSRNHEPVQLSASLEDVRRGARTNWSAKLACEGTLREALSSPVRLAQ